MSYTLSKKEPTADTRSVVSGSDNSADDDNKLARSNGEGDIRECVLLSVWVSECNVSVIRIGSPSIKWFTYTHRNSIIAPFFATVCFSCDTGGYD